MTTVQPARVASMGVLVLATACSLLEPSALPCQTAANCPGKEVCCEDVCQETCSDAQAGCGDGELTTTEVCDDGNQVDGDGCSADCASDETCGNGVVDTAVGEICEPADGDSCTSCAADCRSSSSSPVCGDGRVCAGIEMCDDGWADACGSCNATCTAPGSGSTCGDGQTCPQTEACDDGNTAGGDLCSADCSELTATPMHDPLSYRQRPHAFFYVTAVGANGELVGRASLTAHEKPQTFVTDATGSSVTVLPQQTYGTITSSTLAHRTIFVAGGRLFSVSPTNAAVQQVSGAEQAKAAWLSPDGTRVVYTANPSNDLFVADLDGSNRVKVADGAIDGAVVAETSDVYGSYVVRPHFLPDLSRVIYVARRGDPETWVLYSVAPDGTDRVELNGPLAAGATVG
ncbi:MAG: hypothetical protein V3T05_05800, partial [Myxococcota bacterium]